MKIKLLLLTFVILAGVFTSCQKDEPVTPTQVGITKSSPFRVDGWGGFSPYNGHFYYNNTLPEKVQPIRDLLMYRTIGTIEYIQETQQLKIMFDPSLNVVWTPSEKLPLKIYGTDIQHHPFPNEDDWQVKILPPIIDNTVIIDNIPPYLYYYVSNLVTVRW